MRSAAAEDIGWQEAVARQTQERDFVVTCVAQLKQHGNKSAIDRGRIAYEGAKAEYDYIISGLDVALAENDQPGSLPDLETRFRQGFDKRGTFPSGSSGIPRRAWRSSSVGN